jgi:acyl-CoA thioester hydrolase
MNSDISAFRHSHDIRVRSYHVDRHNVVHQNWYFYFFEEARVEYLRVAGLEIGQGTFVKGDRYYVAHNSCDYLAPALFDDELRILTRISRAGSTSLTFEHLAVRPSDSVQIARGGHVLVHVNEEGGRPSPLPASIVELVRSMENS